ncbi:unnamed protein product [Camellia sinensis]
MVNTFAVAHVFGGSGINSVVGIQDQILHTCFKSCKACKLCGTSEVHHIFIGMLQRLILAVCVVKLQPRDWEEKYMLYSGHYRSY